jgi:hypothetical protein
MVTADNLPPVVAATTTNTYDRMTVDELKKARTTLRTKRTKTSLRLTELRELLMTDQVQGEEAEALAIEEDVLEVSLKNIRLELDYVCALYDEVAEIRSMPAGRLREIRHGTKAAEAPRTQDVTDRPGLEDASQRVVLPDITKLTAGAPSEPVNIRRVPEPVQDVYEDRSPSFFGQSRISESFGTCSLGKANSIWFDNLRCPLRLQSHFDTVEAQLLEAKAGSFDGREFHPHADLKMTLCCKLIKSFEKCTEVHTAAVDAAYASKHSWYHVKNVLMMRFCRRSVLRAAYEKEFESLRFLGHSKVDEYLRRVSRLYHLFVDVYKDDTSERRVLVRKIVSVLPADLASKVIEKIKTYGRSLDQDWELILPFDFTHYNVRVSSTDNSVEEVIRSVCRCAEEVFNIKGNRAPLKDNISYIGTSKDKSSDSVYDKLPGDLKSWVESFSKVISINGTNLKSVKQLKEIAPKAAEVRLCKSKKTGSVYGVVAFKNDEDYEGVAEILEKKNLRGRPFVPIKN